MRNGAPFSKPRVRLYGETGDAQNYLGAAYSLLYKVRQFCEASGTPVFAMQRSLEDGAVVQAAILGNEEIVSCFPPSYQRSEDRGVSEPLTVLAKGGFIYRPTGGATNDRLEPYFFANGTRFFSEPERVFWPEVFHEIRRYKRIPYEDKSFKYREYESPDSDVSNFQFHTKMLAAPVSWRGFRETKQGEKEEVVLTYDHGLPTRYRLSPNQDCSGRFRGKIIDGSLFAQNGKKDLYFRGKRIETAHNVVGAGVFNDTFVYVTHAELEWGSEVPPADSIELADRNSRCATFVGLRGGSWFIIGAVRHTTAFKAPWFFSPDGIKATTCTESISTSYIFEVSIQYDEESKKYTLVESVKTEELKFKLRLPGTAETTETVVGTSGPCGNKSKWEVEPWFMWHPGRRDGKFALDTGYLIQIQDDLYQAVYASAMAQFGNIGQLRKNTNAVDKLSAYIALVRGDTDRHVACNVPYSGHGSDTANPLIWNRLGDRLQVLLSRAARGHDIEDQYVLTQNAYRLEIENEYVFATDYSFDGELLVGRYEFDDFNTKFISTFNTTGFNKRTVSGITGASVQEGTRKTSQWEWDIKQSFSLTINKKTLLAARAGSGLNTGHPSTFSSAYYKRTVVEAAYSNRWWGPPQPYDVISDTNNNEWVNDDSMEESGTAFQTEKVWIVDVDMRTQSAVYNKAVVTADVIPRPLKEGEDPYGVQWAYLDTKSKREDYVVVLHKGKSVVEEKVPSGGSGRVTELIGNLASFALIPRLFTEEEEVQNGIPYAMLAGVSFVQKWRWGVPPGGADCFPNNRRYGRLCVRDPENAVISASDNNNVGVYDIPCRHRPRLLNFFVFAEIHGEEHAVVNSLMKASTEFEPEDPELELEALPDPIRLFPVRAI